MDQIILTEESFLQFVDKDFDGDGESNEKSQVNNSTETVVGGDSFGSTASTSKGYPTNTKIGNNHCQGSDPKRDNDAQIKVANAGDSKLEAMKKVATKNKTKGTKLKLPKKVKKQKRIQPTNLQDKRREQGNYVLISQR